jgi:hypothetical protein
MKEVSYSRKKPSKIPPVRWCIASVWVKKPFEVDKIYIELEVRLVSNKRELKDMK